jgi:hypothetical protein
MGEAAGVAAVLAVDGGSAVRDVDIKALQAQLVEQGAIVDLPAEPGGHDRAAGDDVGLEESIHWQAVNQARAFE